MSEAVLIAVIIMVWLMFIATVPLQMMVEKENAYE